MGHKDITLDSRDSLSMTERASSRGRITSVVREREEDVNGGPALLGSILML